MIAARAAAIRETIARAAARAGRRADEITLVAVSKTHPPEAVREAYAAGVRDFGENKVQEAERKIAALADLRSSLRWHLVGHLQTNKAKKAAALFDRVHSVDSVDLAQKLAAAVTGGEPQRTLDVLVQVDLAGETNKRGADQTHVLALLEKIRELRALRAIGLMILPPYLDDPQQVRPFFAQLRVLRDRAVAHGLLLGSELSMGMSHDFEVAIEEGATLVRIGTALFGERKKP